MTNDNETTITYDLQYFAKSLLALIESGVITFSEQQEKQDMLSYLRTFIKASELTDEHGNPVQWRIDRYEHGKPIEIETNLTEAQASALLTTTATSGEKVAVSFENGLNLEEFDMKYPEVHGETRIAGMSQEIKRLQEQKIHTTMSLNLAPLAGYAPDFFALPGLSQEALDGINLYIAEHIMHVIPEECSSCYNTFCCCFSCGAKIDLEALKVLNNADKPWIHYKPVPAYTASMPDTLRVLKHITTEWSLEDIQFLITSIAFMEPLCICMAIVESGKRRKEYWKVQQEKVRRSMEEQGFNTEYTYFNKLQDALRKQQEGKEEHD